MNMDEKEILPMYKLDYKALCNEMFELSLKREEESLHRYKVQRIAKFIYPIFNCRTGELGCDPMEPGAIEMIGLRVPYYKRDGKYVGCRMGNYYVDGVYHKRYYNPKLGIYTHRYCDLNWDFVVNGIFNSETDIWLKLFNDIDIYIVSAAMNAQIRWASDRLFYIDNAVLYKFYNYTEIITKLV